jgi:hypothetical protein
MPLRPAISCALLTLLACCATHTEPLVSKSEQPLPKAQATALAGMPGTILALRPVASATPGPARILLSSPGTPGVLADEHSFEFIVRTESGTTLSIVQPQTNGLHAGERVSILRGAETRIDVPASD